MADHAGDWLPSFTACLAPQLRICQSIGRPFSCSLPCGQAWPLRRTLRCRRLCARVRQTPKSRHMLWCAVSFVTGGENNMDLGWKSYLRGCGGRLPYARKSAPARCGIVAFQASPLSLRARGRVGVKRTSGQATRRLVAVTPSGARADKIQAEGGGLV